MAMPYRQRLIAVFRRSAHFQQPPHYHSAARQGAAPLSMEAATRAGAMEEGTAFWLAHCRFSSPACNAATLTDAQPLEDVTHSAAKAA